MTREEAKTEIMTLLGSLRIKLGLSRIENRHDKLQSWIESINDLLIDERLARREAEVSAKERGDKCVEWECDYATLETKLEKAEARVKELEEFVRIAPLSMKSPISVKKYWSRQN